MSAKTISECLKAVGVNAASSEWATTCTTIEDEWKVIKKAYFSKILISHPDKGGDPAVFREIQTSFEALRETFENRRIDSFATSGRVLVLS